MAPLQIDRRLAAISQKHARIIVEPINIAFAEAGIGSDRAVRARTVLAREFRAMNGRWW